MVPGPQGVDYAGVPLHALEPAAGSREAAFSEREPSHAQLRTIAFFYLKPTVPVSLRDLGGRRRLARTPWPRVRLEAPEPGERSLPPRNPLDAESRAQDLRGGDDRIADLTHELGVLDAELTREASLLSDLRVAAAERHA